MRELAACRAAGSGPDPQIDRIAAQAAVTLIGEDRQWFKARVGFTLAESARAESFCTHTIRGDGVMVVPDAAEDPRFRDSPLVAGELRARFYAGAPLITASGQRIGAVCVFDPEPRPGLDAEQHAGLAELARSAMAELDLRSDRLRRDDVARFAAAATFALLSVGADGCITYVNEAGERLFGYAPGEMIGQAVDIIVPPAMRARHREGFARMAAGGESRLIGKTVQVTAVRRDGSEFPIEMTLSAWRGAEGVGIGAVICDVSERQARDARLLNLALHDPITGLPNRGNFARLLAARLAEGTAAVLLMHLEGVQEASDDLGTAAADALLQAVIIRLLARIDTAATLARWDGDRLAVMLPDPDPTGLLRVAGTLQDAFAGAFEIGGRSVHVGASIGAAVGPLHGHDAEEVLASADLALMSARQASARGVRLYEPAMREQVASRRALQDAVRRALEKRELVLHYQPQVDLRSGRIVGAEALVRWQHPERGLILPGAFLPAVEASALALHLGWWTIDEVCRQIAAWRVAGLPRVRIALNLYAAQFRAGTLAQTIDEALHRYRLPADVLELEITETIALQNDGADIEPIRVLQARGVGIAFDDFGTGYAALSTLKRFPLTKLKIDRSFVRDLLSDPYDEAIVGAVLAMGNRLGLDVVAEGIETQEQVAALRRMGCPAGQGFLFGRAMPPEAFARHLAVESTPLLRTVSA
ncbi:putative bifunctional diguanylate cyclase/phosphodiesterase [Methylobacterium oryzisoli]|uniref:putative bifunctional diguanylate cyclase/phosphodiesterase n=1 Tax=Methylobacterium oryzisoli TaxID=3385502 RepID=UPI003891C25E